MGMPTDEKLAILRYLNLALDNSVGDYNAAAEQKLATLVTWVTDLSNSILEDRILNLNEYV